MNEKLFQKQKYDRNYIPLNPFSFNDKLIDYTGIISVNTFVPLSKVSKKDLCSDNKSGFFIEESEEDLEKMHPKKNTTMTQQIIKIMKIWVFGLF